MFLNFSPYTFIFSFLYISLLIVLPMLSNFIFFWFTIEIIMLLFMGIAYSCSINLISRLMVFFLAQSVSSFMILVSYVSGMSSLIVLGFLFKIGIFPFSSWFIYSTSSFPSYTLFLACTFHNMPLLFIVLTFGLSLLFNVFLVFISVNILLSGLTACTTFSLRYLLVLSSVGNNSWIMFSAFCGLKQVLAFCFIYFLLLGVLFIYSSSLNVANFSISQVPVTFSCLVLLSGLPLSPVFFVNVFLILSYSLSPLLILFALSTFPMVCSYVIFSMRFFVFSFSRL